MTDTTKYYNIYTVNILFILKATTMAKVLAGKPANRSAKPATTAPTIASASDKKKPIKNNLLDASPVGHQQQRQAEEEKDSAKIFKKCVEILKEKK